MRAGHLPSFKDLPAVEGMPHCCAWGLWDKNGERDSVGSLNLLTPEVVLKARQQIQTGISVALNWPLQYVQNPGFSRRQLSHNIIDLKPEFVAHDDELHINTQSSSQWDGFRHWAHQDTELYYNGLKHEDVTRLAIACITMVLIVNWSKRGGVVGRGILLDYAAWAEKKGIDYSVCSRHCIMEQDLEEIARECEVEFQPGDILIVRSGWVKWYDGATDEERVAKAANGHDFAGLNGTPESVEWLWNKHFAAIPGDAIAFEAWPPTPGSRIHDYSLALFGTPIGELWDLEELAETCIKHNRWSFFLTSAPLNVVGGVASPPNALAIF